MRLGCVCAQAGGGGHKLCVGEVLVRSGGRSSSEWSGSEVGGSGWEAHTRAATSGGGPLPPLASPSRLRAPPTRPHRHRSRGVSGRRAASRGAGARGGERLGRQGVGTLPTPSPLGVLALQLRWCGRGWGRERAMGAARIGRKTGASCRGRVCCAVVPGARALTPPPPRPCLARMPGACYNTL